MPPGFIPIPDWESWENQGADIAITDLDGDGQPEMLVLRVDHRIPGPNAGFYRVGRGLDAQGNVTGNWGPWQQIPDWTANENQGAGLAVADLDGDGHAELIIFQVEQRVPGPNRGRYRIGRKLDDQGNVTGTWSPWREVPGWLSWRNQGAAIAVTDLDGDGQPELIVFQIDDFHGDHPTRPNKGFYRVGHALDPDGQITKNWGDWVEVDWLSWFNQGAGLAVADLDHNGRPELIVFQIDNPDGPNAGLYRIGWNLDQHGKPLDGWGPWVAIDGWGSWEDQDGGLAVADLNGDGQVEAVILHVDNPPGLNEARYQMAALETDLDQARVQGRWKSRFDLPNVAIHTHVLPNGLVLIWGRRDTPTASPDVHECTPFLWDPVTGAVTNTPQPTLADGTKVNLFCAGHAFLPDGRLLVVGGHVRDGEGMNQATIYDPATNTWTPTTIMNEGRWYPTATTLPDGSIVVVSGSFLAANGQIVINDGVQVWNDDAWTSIINFFNLPLYPRMHVVSDGRIFMSGSLAQTYWLNPANGGSWTPLANPGGSRANGQRDYAPAVMYEADKVIYIGGGNDDGTRQPTAAAEIIDLSEAVPQWRATTPMNFRRRQHNATVLPDGTVLVTGGTRGGGGPNNGFNDLGPGQPVHIAELWDPATEVWTELAAEGSDRCYHATAVLLPDATVLSAGGGEYYVENNVVNPPEDSHRDAQIFLPPYLFKGARPSIIATPSSVNYGETFEVGTPQSNDIGKVSWISLPSVTHALDQNQHINFLQFQVGAGKLIVTAPNSANMCPPGHYMLFILSKAGAPSTAKIVQIQSAVARNRLRDGVTARAPHTRIIPLDAVGSEPGVRLQVFDRQDDVVSSAKGTAAVVGITGTCPYGIAACWGGAYEALSHLEAVEMVAPIPNAADSTATVYLEDERLPALDRWDEQFQSIVNGTYVLRGVEVTLQGVIENWDGELYLAGNEQRPRVLLVPLTATDRIQWNHATRAVKPLEAGEDLAYQKLAAARDLAGGQRVTLTGPLKQTDAGYQLHVRLFEA